MSDKRYGNFVRPTSPSTSHPSVYHLQSSVNGEEAKKLYLEEVTDVKELFSAITDEHCIVLQQKRRPTLKSREAINIDVTDKELFLLTQNNEVDIVRKVLDKDPDKINILDDYGWSLLMIACQANSVETVKELLKRGIDTSIRDKGGNSAQSLIIRNKNFLLANIILNAKANEPKHKMKKINTKSKEEFFCEICNNKEFGCKEKHISSTVHNINASKGKKIPANYKIKSSNRGYQMLVKVGWDRESGLGKDGSGKKYPIKAVEKKDRKGLGHDKNKKKIAENSNTVNVRNKQHHQDNRKLEIDFRREFY